MISKRSAKAYCRDDISLIENYDKAIADTTQLWHCHHRRETIYSAKELIEIGEYYNRPACELIFLTPLEHHRLHHLDQHHSAEARKKISEANKGENNPRFGKPSTFKGKHHSSETRKKMSESRKGKNHPFFGKHHSEKTRRKLSKALIGNKRQLGKHWYNNGVVSVLTRECPDGFVKGRIC